MITCAPVPFPLCLFSLLSIGAATTSTGANPEKYYFMERNRLVFVASAKSARLLLLLRRC
jgi:hypothetical protein